MSDDQLLRAHEMMEYVYNVADVAHPVSIRDQMNRGRWLVDKAHGLGFFSAPRSPEYQRLLICGAGAAGVTAAIHAANLGVETVLVEKSHGPFRRQRGCTSRWLDPTQYDWSAEHWDANMYPHAGPVMPLAWVAARSNQLALRWLHDLRAALASLPNLTFRPSEHIVGVPVRAQNASGAVGIKVQFAGGSTEAFGMLLWCVGFGAERCFARPNYTGFAFWESDPFERPHWGVPGNSRALLAFVSGGGDGALQDVIRLATGRKSARDVFEHLTKSGWKLPDDVRHRLFAAEDQAQRALLWCPPKSVDEHKALQELHDSYLQALQDVIRADRNSELLLREIGQVVERVGLPVLLVHPCKHFARCYGLNHFLILLLEAVATELHCRSGSRNRPFLEIRQGLGLATVTGLAGHTCAGNPWACHGLQHQIDLQWHPVCHGGPGGPAGVENAEVVVVRHGISPNPAFAGTHLAFARQVMPYHLP